MDEGQGEGCRIGDDADDTGAGLFRKEIVSERDLVG